MEQQPKLPKRRPGFKQFPSCCGAGLDLGGRRLLSYEGEHELAMKRSMRSFAIANAVVPGAVEVSPGISVVSYGTAWSPEMSFKGYTPALKSDSIAYHPNNVDVVMSASCNIIHNFSTNNSSRVSQRIKQQLSVITDSVPTFAILAAYFQHAANEVALIDCGFQVISRRISPRTQNPLTLFMKPKAV